MANMSYCRFENTASALRDCADHILDSSLPRDEEEARARLVLTCLRIIEELELDDNPTLPMDRDASQVQTYIGTYIGEMIREQEEEEEDDED